MKFYKKIYLSSDALFDLRQGTLNLISTQFAIDVTVGEAYYVREEDLFSTPNFGLLSKENFKQVQQQHLDKIFKISGRTKIIEFVKQLYLKLIKTNGSEAVELELSLEINLFPLTLTPEETEQLRSAVESALNGQMPVSISRYDPRTLTADMVNSQYIGMIFYDYVPWLNSFESEFKKKKNISSTALYVPRLYFDGKPSGSTLAPLEKEKIDPFEMWEHIYSPILKINYLPVAFFCVDLPANVPELTVPIS